MFQEAAFVRAVLRSILRVLHVGPEPDRRWDAEGVEDPVPDEEGKTKKVVKVVNRMQKHNFDKRRHAFRANHVKPQGIVNGILTIPDKLPSQLAQGLFAYPGSYPVCARYANEPVLLQPDIIPGPRSVLSDWPFDHFNHQPAKYESKIQLGTDPAHHPTATLRLYGNKPQRRIGQLVS
ncbi:MAG: hypothetical protein Q9181_003882 [Wetmoreana brouardii]